MSTKTILNRIAKVAVAALLGGFLTVVSAPLANAAVGDIAIGTGTSQGVGTCAVLNTATGAYSVVDNQSRNHTSTLAAPLAVTIPVGGTVDLNPEGTAAGGGFITYTSGLASDDTTAEVLHSSYGVYAVNMSGDSDTLTLTATAVGTISVKAYLTAPFSAPNAANTILATPNGALTISVVASCSNTGFSATYSSWQVGGAVDSTPSKTFGDTLTFGAGDDGYISIIGKNAYDQVLPASTTWIASATNNAKVKFGTDSTIEASTTARGTLSSVSTTADGDPIYVRVSPADRAAGGSTTVTVTADGVTVVSKTLTFLPEATKLVIVKHYAGSISGGEGAFSYQLQTASGQVVPGSIAGRSATYDSRVTSATGAKDATIFAAASAGTTNAVNNTTWFGATTSNGIMVYACNAGTTTGKTTVTFRHTTPVTETVIDTPVELTCARGLDTYTVSMDKASYKIGEVATLTVTAKDSSGAAVNDFTVVGTGATISVGGGTIVKALNDGALGTGDQFTSGVKTYQIQMTTAGTFNTVVNFPGATTKSQTVGYSVVDGSGTVTNAEVLAAIVKLIASINKQIKQLQKQLKR